MSENEYSYSSEPASQETSEEILASQTNGKQKTQIISPNGQNLGTSSNPVFVQLESGAVEIGNVGILDAADNRINPAKEDGNLANISTVEGTVTDAAVTTDTNGTTSGKLRGLVKIFADVWDSTSHFLKVNIQNASIAVTQSGVWTTGRTWVLGSGTDSVTVVGSVSVNNLPTTQPINGTVTANQGTPTSLVNAWPVELSDGINVLGTPAHPVRIDPTGTTVQPVSGIVTITPSGTQDENIKQVNGANVNVGIGASGLGTQRVAVSSDSFPATQAVSEADGTNVALGAKADAVATTDTGTFSSISLFKRLLTFFSKEDDLHVNGDKGIMALAVRQDSDVAGTFSGTDGDYNPLAVNHANRLKVDPNGLYIFDFFQSLTGWTAIDTDTTNLALNNNHITPDPTGVTAGKSISFDKVDTAANNTYSLIQKTITAVNLFNATSASPFLQFLVYIPDTTNVISAVLRVGTDSSNYNEWNLLTTDGLVSASWNRVRLDVTEPTSFVGNGWNPLSVTYLAVGLKFNLQTNTLAGILVDSIAAIGGTTSDTQTSSSSVATDNVNVAKWNGNAAASNVGGATNGTPRVVLANNDPLVTNIGDVSDAVVAAGAAGSASAKLRRLTTDTDAIKTSIQLIDDTIFAEDAAHSSGDKGIMVLGVRNDARVAKTNADGDYSAYATDQYGNILIAYPTGAFNNGAETAVAGTAVNVSAANTANIKIILQNTGIANARVGITGVTATTGFRLVPGGQAIFERNDGAQGDIFAIREGAISTTILAQPIR